MSPDKKRIAALVYAASTMLGKSVSAMTLEGQMKYLSVKEELEVRLEMIGAQWSRLFDKPETEARDARLTKLIRWIDIVKLKIEDAERWEKRRSQNL